ncbi:MAG: family transporter [Chitinophagaceae bacterium]|nr:family transporter [Chitinophagaceae bacterium]
MESEERRVMDADSALRSSLFALFLLLVWLLEMLLQHPNPSFSFMEIKTTDQPSGILRFTLVLICLCIAMTLVFLGQQIIVPLLLALLFAILLNPMVSFLNRRLRVPNVLAVLISCMLLFAFLGGILMIIYWQAADISHEWPTIKHNFSMHIKNGERWINQTFHVSGKKQEQYVQETAKKTLDGGMGDTLSSFTNTAMSLILIPLYTFLILLYRKLFVNFLCKIVPSKEHKTLIDILVNIGSIVQNYIVGLIIEMFIVASLTTGGLMLLGVPYAILLGVITALLNLIPYIGILFAALLTVLAALTASTDPTIVIKIGFMIWGIQLFDNNFLVPKVVGNKVQINALVSILGVILFGTLAGIAGMFLALPMIAILKVIFDRVESLKPYGYLIGDDLPKTVKWNKIVLPDFNHGGEEKRDLKSEI